MADIEKTEFEFPDMAEEKTHAKAAGLLSQKPRKNQKLKWLTILHQRIAIANQ